MQKFANLKEMAQVGKTNYVEGGVGGVGGEGGEGGGGWGGGGGGGNNVGKKNHINISP